MNQTQKRLQIINIAISITDIDTIQLQMLKLNQIKTDEKLQDILSTLDNRNYAKAQTLIQEYIQQPMSDDIVQRVDEENFSNEELAKLDLYVEEPQEDTEPIEIDLDEMLKIHKQSITKEDKFEKKLNVDFDTLLNITTEDIKTQEIDLNLHNHISQDNHTTTPTTEETNINEDDLTKHTYQYPAIPYIKKKFQDMLNQYPLMHPKFDSFISVERWIQQIEKDGYSEDNIEEMIQYIQQIINKNPAEAAQLLLVSAATKSIYAKFMLARELYKGSILEQNKNEAFQMIYDLAINEEYPEAICDLAQFYEYGIGVKKDTKKALKLYDEAMQLGITRAMRNYDRLSKQKKSLFGLF